MGSDNVCMTHSPTEHVTTATVDGMRRVSCATHVIKSTESWGERVVRFGKTNGSPTAGKGAPLNGRVAVDKCLQRKEMLRE